MFDFRKKHPRFLLRGTIYDRDLIIQRPKIMDVADSEYPKRA